MSLVDAVDIPFLRLSDPTFSIRSTEVREARERSWYARTPYGIAVLRYDDVGKLLRDPRLRQGSYAWPAHNNVTGIFADWWLRIMLNRVGDDHARLRRLANPAFSPKLIIPLQPRFAELVERHRRRLRRTRKLRLRGGILRALCGAGHLPSAWPRSERVAAAGRHYRRHGARAWRHLQAGRGEDRRRDRPPCSNMPTA